MPHLNPLSSFVAGARDTLPMLIGAAPLGVIFGALVAASQLALWQGQFMSFSVFAGASQLIVVGLTASQAGMLVIWMATFIINLRYILYAATLLPHVSHLPARWRWLLGFLMTDETFAVMNAYYMKHAHTPHGHWYFLGSSLSMYGNWQLWTLVGLLFGVAFPQLRTLGLDFAMVATFIAIVVPQLFCKPQLAAAIAAGVSAWLLHDLPYKLGLMAAATAGVAAGLASSHWLACIRAARSNA